MGLDNFNTSEDEVKKSPGEKLVDSDDETKSKIADLMQAHEEKRKGMGKDELERLRSNHRSDYFPEKTLEEGWSYRDAVAIECVCGDRLIVDLNDKKQCDCTREYANTSRAVVMVSRKE